MECSSGGRSVTAAETQPPLRFLVRPDLRSDLTVKERLQVLRPDNRSILRRVRRRSGQVSGVDGCRPSARDELARVCAKSEHKEGDATTGGEQGEETPERSPKIVWVTSRTGPDSCPQRRGHHCWRPKSETIDARAHEGRERGSKEESRRHGCGWPLDESTTRGSQAPKRPVSCPVWISQRPRSTSITALSAGSLSRGS